MAVGSPGARLPFDTRCASIIGFDGERDSDQFWHTDICKLRDGRWQAVWSQATRIR
jgi:hypothetical protein